MEQFASYDGTVLAYHRKGGTGDVPLVCLPGGPASASFYLGDLGGLSAERPLILLDSRGAGDSDTPADPDSYRCIRLVDDVEALRRHLGLARMDLLSHSAAGNLAMLYAARHPDRLSHLVLVAPSWLATGLEFSDEEWLEALRRRRDEPWFDEVYAAVMRVNDGKALPGDRETGLRLFHGTWTPEVVAYVKLSESAWSTDARAGYGAGDAPFGDPAELRAGLKRVEAPVLVLGGELDPAPTPRLLRELAGLFPHGTAVAQPGSGHSPWLDDPTRFVTTVGRFLTQ